MNTVSHQEYPPGQYLIQRHGGWFRENGMGYTRSFHDVGIYSREEAMKYLDVDGLTIHHVSTVIDKIEAEANRLLHQVMAIEGVLIQLRKHL